jgi:hypothetical protein
LPQQVQQRRFQGRDGVNGGAQVEGLLTAPAPIPGGEGLAHARKNAVVGTERATEHQRLGVFDGLADGFAAGHFPDARMSGGVLEDHEVAREEGAVRSAQVEQHAVVTGDGDRPQLIDNGCCRGLLQACFDHAMAPRPRCAPRPDALLAHSPRQPARER